MLLCCMDVIGDVFKIYRSALNGVYDAKEAEAIALLVTGEITGLSKAAIKAFSDEAISPEQAAKLSQILERLKTGEPVQYILGHTEFYGLPFKVSPAVLIPRPETEELVEWILASVGSSQLAVGSGQSAVGRILDVGTGSGCIAISLKKNLPGFTVSAIDISEAAITIAKENAVLNNVELDFIHADILNVENSFTTHHSPLATHDSQLTVHRSPFTPTYDLIVSNPPYVTHEDKTRVHKNVTDFEPHTALFVPEDDPLLFYKAIADFARTHLSKNGLLFFEINEGFGKEIVALLAEKGFEDIQLKKDMNGKDRMINGRLK